MKVALGIGCDRDTPWQTLSDAIAQALTACGLTHATVDRVASIDLKSDETGLLTVVAWNNWPVQFFSAEALARVSVPNPSETVRRHTGTPSVAEAAALLAAGATAEALLIEKHRLRGPDGRNATISIARIPE